MEINYKIIKKLGILSDDTKKWKKELNLVSWNDNEPKYDIRDWDETHSKMSKGITLTKEEMLKLKEILNKIEIED
ncbi:MAG TPA: PC4/YdbC family ssDNA-binding protein [Ignavibacteriales bacterium]|jgi:hypothetical protein|nr:PC4/YdbC family ssDNA-binding protein [Ignavibacteriales bacterium]